MQNPTQLKAAYEDAQKSAGSAARENEKHLDSIQGRIDLFINAVQTFWTNLIDDQWVKSIVDIGTTGVKILDTWYGKAIAILAAVDSRTTKLGSKLWDKFIDKLNVKNFSKKISSAFQQGFNNIVLDTDIPEFKTFLDGIFGTSSEEKALYSKVYNTILIMMELDLKKILRLLVILKNN